MFTFFPQLAAELRLKIWEATYRRPGVHIFDVCLPSPWPSDTNRASRAFTDLSGTIANPGNYAKYRDQVFLDKLQAATGGQGTGPGTEFRRDPSAYSMARMLSMTCVESAEFVRTQRYRDKTEDIHEVFLPGKGQTICYDNSADMICLRFGPRHTIQDKASEAGFDEADPISGNSITRALEDIWSEDMASALWSARRVAIDISELMESSRAPSFYRVRDRGPVQLHSKWS